MQIFVPSYMWALYFIEMILVCLGKDSKYHNQFQTESHFITLLFIYIYGNTGYGNTGCGVFKQGL